MRLTTRPSIRLSLALLIAATISCNDTVTGPALVAPDGSILLSDSVFTRGATVRASVNAPAGFTLVPGSVEWSVSSATATLTNVGTDDDSVDVALRVAGPMRLTARYRLRSSSGAGSSITIAAPTSRSGGEVWVDAGRSFDVATPLLDYIAVPAGSVSAGLSLGTVQVALKDIRGRIIPAATDSVVIALDPTSGSTGATLLGTLRARPVDGIATFTGTSIQKAGTGYRLVATSRPCPRATRR